MRTTINIDDDLIATAQSVARANAQSVGRVLSDWARKGLSAEMRIDDASDYGFPQFRVAPNAPAITAEDVKKAEDDW